LTAPRPRILLFGGSGKVGTALRAVFAGQYQVTSPGRDALDVRDGGRVRQIVSETGPDIVINAAAFAGIDACEDDPAGALEVNTLFPKLLAELSRERGFLLVHFSSDAVFSGRSSGYYDEQSAAAPVNMYGFTKFGADCFISAIAKRYYIARISIQFGACSRNAQFVEKMLEKVSNGQRHLRISDDITASPSHSADVARAVRQLIEGSAPSGLYHIANSGKASLYRLICEMVSNLGLDAAIDPVPQASFPSKGVKNGYTPITSTKLPPLRSWQEAAADYCSKWQR